MKPNLSNYFVPLFVAAIGIVVLVSDPNKKISTRMPIVVGEYQLQIAGAFFALALILALIVRRYERNRDKRNGGN